MATTTNVQKIALTAINPAIKTYQVRQHGINPEHVEGLVNSNPENWQPLVLKQLDDSSYAIISGFHRYEAATQLKLTDIAAQVAPNTLTHGQTQLTAYRYNSEHGLPLTIAEKKHYAVLLHLEKPELAHYKIAQIAHISDKTVTSAIEEYEASLKQQAATTEETTDGAATDATTEDTTEDITIDVDAKFKKFASALRKFYTDVVSEVETNDGVVQFLTAQMTKQATTGENAYDGDYEVLKTYADVFTKAAKKLAPRLEPKAKAPAKATATTTTETKK